MTDHDDTSNSGVVDPSILLENELSEGIPTFLQREQPVFTTAEAPDGQVELTVTEPEEQDRESYTDDQDRDTYAVEEPVTPEGNDEAPPSEATSTRIWSISASRLGNLISSRILRTSSTSIDSP